VAAVVNPTRAASDKGSALGEGQIALFCGAENSLFKPQV